MIISYIGCLKERSHVIHIQCLVIHYKLNHWIYPVTKLILKVIARLALKIGMFTLSRAITFYKAILLFNFRINIMGN